MYECIRCGYSSNYKHSVISHLKRKRPCKPILLDVDCCILLEDLTNETRPKNKIVKKIVKTSAKRQPSVSQTSAKRSQTSAKNLTQDDTMGYNCCYCGKPFKHRQSKFKHENLRCREKTAYDRIQALKNEVEELRLKNEVLELKHENQLLQSGQRHTVSETTINGNNNHNKSKNVNSFNTVNVHLNTIGNENIEYLKSFIMKNIGDIIQCKTEFFIEYIKQKHFHPDHLENHNVVSFNQRSKSLYAYTKNDTHLERRLKNNMSLILYKNIIDDTSRFLENLTHKKKVKPKRLIKYNRASDSLDLQLDAVSDYERKGIEDEYDETEKKQNIRMVDTHLNEIQNTIYNESKTKYGSMHGYYGKHNTGGDNTDPPPKDE